MNQELIISGDCVAVVTRWPSGVGSGVAGCDEPVIDPVVAGVMVPKAVLGQRFSRNLAARKLSVIESTKAGYCEDCARWDGALIGRVECAECYGKKQRLVS